LDNIYIRKKGPGNKKQKTIKQMPNELKQSKLIRPTDNLSSLNSSKQVTIQINQTQKTVQEIKNLDQSPNSAAVSVKDKGAQIFFKDRDMFMFDQEVTISVKPF
jgi:hypothetical protein